MEVAHCATPQFFILNSSFFAVGSFGVLEMLDIFSRVEQVERVGFSWRGQLELESGGFSCSL